MEPDRATLDRHAALIRRGFETYALAPDLAEQLKQYTERQGIRSEIIERRGSIIVRAINADLLREAFNGS